MTKEELISQIMSTISANGNQDITGTKLQEVLVSIVGTLYSAIDEAIISASPGDFTELILQSLGSRVDATISQKAITDALTALNYGINAIPVFARIERVSLEDDPPSVVNSSTALPGEIVYVIYGHPYFKEGFYWKASDNKYYTWFGDAHLYKVDVNTPVRYNKLFECAEDGKQYVIVSSLTIEKPNLVVLGADSSSAAVESNDIPKFNGIVKDVISIDAAFAQTYEGIYFSTLNSTFVAKLGTDYYATWDTSHLYKEGHTPITNRLFEYNKRQYVFDGQELKLLTVNSVEFAQKLGDSTELAMSQRAVTEALSDKLSVIELSDLHLEYIKDSSNDVYTAECNLSEIFKNKDYRNVIFEISSPRLIDITTLNVTILSTGKAFHFSFAKRLQGKCYYDTTAINLELYKEGLGDVFKKYNSALVTLVVDTEKNTLELRFDNVELAQELGDSTELAMSQRAVTEAVDSIVGDIDSILDSIINT